MVYENYARSMAYLRSPFDKHANWRKQAELLRLSKEAKQRLDWLVYYEAKADKNASKTCRHFSIAPKVFYTWKNRFDGQNLRLLESKSKAPIRKRRRAIASEEESRIVALRKQHIRWGKMKLERLYKNIYGTTISSWKIQYTIHKYKLYYHPKKNEKLQAKRKRSQKKKRITELNKEFVSACQELNLTQYWSRTHTPKDNPVDERFNRTLKEEFIQLGNYTDDVLTFNQRLTEWLIEYTFIRPHQTLGYDTPWEFYQKTAKVLPMYSSRTLP